MADLEKKFFRHFVFFDFGRLEVADVVEIKNEKVCFVIEVADRALEVADVLESAAQKNLKK